MRSEVKIGDKIELPYDTRITETGIKYAQSRGEILPMRKYLVCASHHAETHVCLIPLSRGKRTEHHQYKTTVEAKLEALKPHTNV